MIKSCEDAYHYLAQEVLSFVNERQWESAGAKYEILNQSIGASWWLELNGLRDETGPFPSRETSALATDAVRFLSKDIARTSESRIWGLGFTLYPDGKFNIVYEYNRPDGYEDSDATISGEEINKSLNQILSQRNK